jgi:hypothetical protein
MKPQGMEVNEAGIPSELKEDRRWVLWRWELRDGKWTKPPKQPNGEMEGQDSALGSKPIFYWKKEKSESPWNPIPDAPEAISKGHSIRCDVPHLGQRFPYTWTRQARTYPARRPPA